MSSKKRAYWQGRQNLLTTQILCFLGKGGGYQPKKRENPLSADTGMEAPLGYMNGQPIYSNHLPAGGSQ